MPPLLRVGSVSCTEESINQRLEKAKGAGSGQHAGKRRSKQQTRAVREVVEGVKAHREREPRWAYTVEQPRGSAMAEMATVKKHLGRCTLPTQGSPQGGQRAQEYDQGEDRPVVYDDMG